MKEQKRYRSFDSVLAALILACCSVAWAKNETYTGPCTKNVSSAVVTSTGAEPLFPDFVTNWWKKNAKNFPGVCLSSKPSSTARNYLLVFSTSQSYYTGLMPTTHTYTNTSSTAFSANGSAMDQYGNRWNYTATGDAQTTTATTVNENVPYTDRAVGLFTRTYDSTGRIIRSDGHLYRTRTGGDASNTAGYNIGSALSNINARGKMVKSALLAIVSDQDAPLPVKHSEEASVQTASAIQSPAAAAAATTVKTDNRGGSSGDAEENATSPVRMVGATAEISSDPPDAEIEIDGNFVGSTPSSVGIAAGEHTLRVSKSGYKSWERTLRSSTGSIRIAATLEPTPIVSAGAAQTREANPDLGIAPSSARIPEPASRSPAGPPEEALIGVSFEGNPTVRHDGVEIYSVQPRGPAHDIDLRAGDVILAIDAHYLFTVDDVRAELSRYKSGARVLMRYRRNQFISENYLTLR
jgi:PEGA domain-containing protein/PDZ domain-containing protein